MYQLLLIILNFFVWLRFYNYIFNDLETKQYPWFIEFSEYTHQSKTNVVTKKIINLLYPIPIILCIGNYYDKINLFYSYSISYYLMMSYQYPASLYNVNAYLRFVLYTIFWYYSIAYNYYYNYYILELIITLFYIIEIIFNVKHYFRIVSIPNKLALWCLELGINFYYYYQLFFVMNIFCYLPFLCFILFLQYLNLLSRFDLCQI